MLSGGQHRMLIKKRLRVEKYEGEVLSVFVKYS